MIKFLKVTDVKSPERDYGNGGIDFYIPSDVTYLKGEVAGAEMPVDPVVVKNSEGDPVLNGWDGNTIVIPPYGSVLIPLGVRYLTDDPSKHIYICNKSGVSTKKGLMVGACLCDHSYENVAHAHLISTRSVPVKIEPGDKIVQGMVIISQPDEIEVSDVGSVKGEEFYAGHMKNRGLNGFGSTGTK